ncbi:hypothetical protein AVEN_204901-1 [Araneus ventricosus]|uniref:Uncharacterized protein n=1 Tax=Araneus ventricosus TaxID=182803 RepID=A0A4Y2NZK1_ARAVE|nr:hypothetical protein AVEN_204901-1 [Araneus ventricosus]
MLELKSRNHLTTGEARRIFSHSSNANYATAVKSNMINDDFEPTVNQKIRVHCLISLRLSGETNLAFEEKMKQRTLAFHEKMEQQTLMKMFEKIVDTLLQTSPK